MCRAGPTELLLVVAWAWRASIAAHFKALRAAARLVEAAVLDERVETAPTFTP